jgi:hypothetical protein
LSSFEELKSVAPKKRVSSGTIDHINLIVLGSFVGANGSHSSFLCGVYNEEAEKLHTVCRLRLSSEAALIVRERARMRRRKGGLVPKWLEFNSRQCPDFYVIAPDSSVVLEVCGTGLSFSDVHSAGITLRSPRVTRVRTDKTYMEATTLRDLQKLARRVLGQNNSKSSKSNGNAGNPTTVESEAASLSLVTTDTAPAIHGSFPIPVPATTKAKKQKTANSIATGTEDVKDLNVNMRKVVLLLMYCGREYSGFSTNELKLPSVERILEDALSRCGWIPENYRRNQGRMKWTRSAATERSVSAASNVVAVSLVSSKL